MVRILGLTASDLELTDNQLVQLLALETFVKPEVTTGEPGGFPVTTSEVVTDSAPVTSSSRSSEARETTHADPDITITILSGSSQSKIDVPILVTILTTPVSTEGSTNVDVPPENFSTEDPGRGFSTSKPSESYKASTSARSVEIATTLEVDETFTLEVTNLLTSSTNGPSTVIPPEENVFQSSFKLQEPETGYFEVLPSLDNVTLTCDVIVASKDVAVALSPSDIQRMESNDVLQCIESFGRMRWPKLKLKSIWRAIKSKVPSFLKGNIRPLKRFEMLQLQNILPAVAVENPELLDMNRTNIDGLSFLGRYYF